MSRYFIDPPLDTPPFFPSSHVGVGHDADGPSSDSKRCSTQSDSPKATKQSRLEDADCDPLDDSASSSLESTGTSPLAPSSSSSSPSSSCTRHTTPLLSSSSAHPSSSDDEVPPSKFTDKLHTNYIPSFQEIAEIEQYVGVVDTKLAAYDAHIAELETALHKMHVKRRHLHELNAAHRALSSPFRRLPPEILQLIFVGCLPKTRNAVMHASEAPVLLGRVCSEWRRIALATPELWASLHIVPPNVNFQSPVASTARFRRKKELIEMWLARSGVCPISVSMVWFAGDSEEEVRLCGTLLDVLVPLCARWRSLDFQVPLKMFRPFIGLKVVDVPLLEGLTLMDNRTPADMDTVGVWPESLNFAESATKLRTFTLTLFSGGIKLPSIPWPQLTTLYLESNIAFFFADAKEMLSILGLCVHLVHCTLKFPLSHTTALPGYEKLSMEILLPELEVLCLDGDQHLMNTFHMNNTLENICAPKLRRLEILGRAGRTSVHDPTTTTTTTTPTVPEPLTAISELLQKSKCPLEKLNLESLTTVPGEFIRCLKLVPTLDELVVHNWTARVFTPTIAAAAAGLPVMPQDLEDANASDGQAHGTNHNVKNTIMDLAENQILLALTLSKSEDDFDVVIAPKKTRDVSVLTEGSSELDVVGAQGSDAVVHDGSENEQTLDDLPLKTLTDPSTSTSTSNNSTTPPLLPNLQKFDFTLCDASQHLLCNFIASRWDTGRLPPGVRRLRSVKTNFSALEKEEVRERMRTYKAGGLDVCVIYQVPMSDELNPSPWTGLEGPP